MRPMRLAHVLRTTAAGALAVVGGCWRPEPAYEPPPASYTVVAVDLADGAGGTAPQRLRAASVRPAFFPADVPAVLPLLGRTFVAADYAEPGAGRVVVLSDRLWRQRYGGRPQLIGHTIQLDGHPTAVVGVMPPTFDVPAGADLWMPAPR